MNSDYVIVGVAAIVIGLLIGGVAWTHIAPYREDLNNSTPVDSVVQSSDVVQSTNSEGETVYRPAVTYRYTYEGVEYTSSSIFPGDVNPVNDRSRAEEIAEQYQAGDEVTAYVNTDEPETAFLIEQRAPLWFWAGPVIGVLMNLYGIHSAVLGIRGVESSAGVE